MSDIVQGIIVQKFGGTSVGSSDRLKLVANIIKTTAINNRVVVVVSALSPEVKANGTTSLLLKAAKSAIHAEDYTSILSNIREYHRETATAALSTPALKDNAIDFIDSEISRLETILKAFSVLREHTPVSHDSVIATGEKLSAKLLSLVLEDQGLAATYEDLSEIVKLSDSDSDNELFDAVQASLAKRFGNFGASIPVLTGFFGPVRGGLLERVGRGYTDFTAALVTAGIGPTIVKELQVWKEVDGICSADPRRVPNARVLDQLSVSEAAELTHFGSEVLHPFTMARVAQGDIPIRVKNTFRPDLPGTLVVNNPLEHQYPISAITAKKGITTVTVTANRMYDSYGFLAGIFAVLKAHAVVVDLVSTSEVSISFTVDQTDNLMNALPEIEKFGAISIARGQAILAVVGENMHTSIATPAKFFSALSKAGIDIHMISKGASRINLSCVVSADCVDAALPAVHDAFFS